MRRLPVYLLLDTSGSMSGEPIEAVKNGVQVLVSTLRQDPYALETAYISVITFESNAQQLVPLTDLASFQPPSISAGGGTSLGAGLKLLAECIDREVGKSTPEQKGDWKPLVFIMTDGGPTDQWQSGLAEFQRRKVGITVACAAGGAADTNVLKQITEVVVQLIALFAREGLARDARGAVWRHRGSIETMRSPTTRVHARRSAHARP